MSTLGLLVDRRFWPLFWVQFLTAFNDNVLKTGLVLLVTFGEDLYGAPVTVLGLGAGPLNAAGGLLLMIPFFTFSATAGQLADREPKSRLMRQVKAVEVGLMLLAAGGFAVAALGLPGWAGGFLLAVVFLMGTQSAMFGPIKYSILPQLLPRPGELLSGNALVETGTYISVLLAGVVATGLFVAPRWIGLPPRSGLYLLGAGVLGLAMIGWLIARLSPDVPAEAPDLQVRWDPFRSTWRVAREALSQGDLRFAVMANSWFWALGAAVLTLFPTWVENTLHADEYVFALFMATFSVGIGAGSLLCARISRGRLELGVVAIAAVGIAVFLADLFLAGSAWPAPVEGRHPILVVTEVGGAWQATGLLTTFTGWRLLVDVLGMAASGGVFMVPLYTFLQRRGEAGERARIIGALNVVNALFIVGALGVVMGLLAAGVSERLQFAILAGAQLAWAVACYLAMPAHTMRFIAEMLAFGGYRLTVEGEEHIPREGAALLMCNHVSFFDFIMVMAAVRRRHRFVIWHEFAKMPVASTLTGQYEVIPITNDPNDRRTLVAAFKAVSEALRDGQLVVIFPEGGLPYEPGLQPFGRGLELILKRDPVPVIPMAINGLWGSMFSRSGGAAFRSWRPPRRQIWLTIGEPLDPAGLTTEQMRAAMEDLYNRRPER